MSTKETSIEFQTRRSLTAGYQTTFCLMAEDNGAVSIRHGEYNGSVAFVIDNPAEFAAAMLAVVEMAEARARAPVQNEPPRPRLSKLYPRIGQKLPAWAPEDGEMEGHYRNNPPGHRCIQSVNWGTPRGLLEADAFLPMENVTTLSLTLELTDIADRHGVDAAEAAEHLARIEADLDRGQASRFLATARTRYPEYPCPFDPPVLMRKVAWRPGWGPTE